MRSVLAPSAILLVSGVLLAGSGDDKPNLSGTWKLDQPRTESSSFNARLKLLIEQKDQNDFDTPAWPHLML